MVGFHTNTKIEHIFPLTLFVSDDDYLWHWSQYDIFIISIFNKKERANCMLTSPSRHKHNRGGSWTVNIWYLAENYDWLKGARGLLYPSLSHTHTHSLSLSHAHTHTLYLTHTHIHTHSYISSHGSNLCWSCVCHVASSRRQL